MNLSREFDLSLLLAGALAILFGITMIYSASSPSAVWKSQATYGVIFLLLAAAIVYIPDKVLYGVAYPLYGVSILSLLAVLAWGTGESARWLSLGSVSVQPSEFAKVALIIAVARYFSRNRRPEGYTLRDLLMPAFLVGLPMLLIVKEPDLGTSLILLFIFLTLLFLERLRTRTWVVLIVGLATAVPAMWGFGLRDYQRDRIETFLQPDKHKFGKGWQARQSQIAVGSGGLSGKGYMGSTQSFGRFLPETRTDFILATFAEEHGFLGCVVLLGLYFFVIVWATQIGYHARDRFGAIVSVGVAAMMFWHVLINVGMVIGLLPVVGVTLPLMSRGGSSVLAVLIGVGLLLNVSMRRHPYG